MMFISVFGTFGASGKAEAEENENFVPGQAIVCFKSDKSKALSEKQQDSFVLISHACHTDLYKA